MSLTAPTAQRVSPPPSTVTVTVTGLEENWIQPVFRPQPPWAHREIHEDLGIRSIEQKGRDDDPACLTLFPEGRLGIDPRVGDGTNPLCFFLMTTLTLYANLAF